MNNFTDLQAELKAIDALALSPARKTVLAEILIRENDPNDSPIFAYSPVAEDLGFAVSTVSTAARELAAEGYISRVRVLNGRFAHKVNRQFLRERVRQARREAQAEADQLRSSFLLAYR